VQTVAGDEIPAFLAPAVQDFRGDLPLDIRRAIVLIRIAPGMTLSAVVDLDGLGFDFDLFAHFVLLFLDGREKFKRRREFFASLRLSHSAHDDRACIAIDYRDLLAIMEQGARIGHSLGTAHATGNDMTQGVFGLVFHFVLLLRVRPNCLPYGYNIHHSVSLRNRIMRDFENSFGKGNHEIY
jgi:hypothetical protein